MKNVILVLVMALASTVHAAADDQQQFQQAQQVANTINTVEMVSTALSCAIGNQGQCLIGITESSLEHLPRHYETQSGWIFDSTLIHKTRSFNID